MFKCFKDKDFLKRFFKLAFPVMVSSFVTFLVTFLDNIMVGTVSEEAVSGVYAANQVSFIYNLAIFGVLEGAGIFIQQFYGAKDNESMKQSFRYKIVMCIGFLLVVMPMVFFLGKYLVGYFCESDSNYEAIYKEGMDYLYIIAISYIPFAVSNVYFSSLRETGRTNYAMVSSLIAIFINTALNAVFIMGLGWGVKGAAIATLIARCCELIYLILICKIKKFEFCHGAFKNFTISKDLFKRITSKSWLLFINEIGWAVGSVLQSLAFSQRDGVLAAISVVSTLSNIFMILINGLSVAIGVMVGSRLGANEFDKAKDEASKLNWLGFYMSIVMGAVLIALAWVIPNVFVEVSDIQKALATKLIIIYASLLWANCLAITFYFVLRAGGKTILTFLFDTGMMLALYVPVAWILAKATTLDMVYIFLIVRLIDAVKMVLGLVFIKSGTWVRNLTITELKEA